MDPAYRAELRREAAFIHEKLFGAPAPDGIPEAYAEAHKIYCCAGMSRRIDLEEVMAKNLDVEAVEFATRRPDAELWRKFQILFYLLEGRSSHYSMFVNEEEDRIGGFLRLGVAPLRSAYKFIKGRALIWRYHLV